MGKTFLTRLCFVKVGSIRRHLFQHVDMSEVCPVGTSSMEQGSTRVCLPCAEGHSSLEQGVCSWELCTELD